MVLNLKRSMELKYVCNLWNYS